MMQKMDFPYANLSVDEHRELFLRPALRMFK